MKAFSEEEVKKLTSFIGYGNLHGKVWFIGMEEGGGDEENLHSRLNFENVEDCRDAMKKLEIFDWHWGTQKIQRTWRGMCYIMLVLANISPSKENIRKYQVEKLGRKNCDTLLTELMPLPKPNLGSWTYRELFPQFVSLKKYYSEVKPNRIKMFRNLFATHNPELVVCYGKKYWSDFMQFFPLTKFKSENGSFYTANTNETKIFLTDHFTSRTMNDGIAILAQYIKSAV